MAFTCHFILVHTLKNSLWPSEQKSLTTAGLTGRNCVTWLQVIVTTPIWCISKNRTTEFPLIHQFSQRRNCVGDWKNLWVKVSCCWRMSPQILMTPLFFYDFAVHNINCIIILMCDDKCLPGNFHTFWVMGTPEDSDLYQLLTRHSRLI